MNTPRGIFGDAAWPCSPAGDAAAIVAAAERYCPEWPLTPRADGVFEAACSLYSDYRLVCFCEPPLDGEWVATVYGFHAQGDFRPLDPFGLALAHLDATGPLRLTDASVVHYVLLRLCSELPVLDASAALVAGGLDALTAGRLLVDFGPGAVQEVLSAPPVAGAAPWDEPRWREALRAHADEMITRHRQAPAQRLWPVVVRKAEELPLAPGAAIEPAIRDLVAPPTVAPFSTVAEPALPNATSTRSGYRVGVSLLLPGPQAEIRRVTVEVSTDGTGFAVLKSERRALDSRLLDTGTFAATAPIVRRTDTAMVDATWRRLTPEEDGTWRHALRIFDFDRASAVLRLAALPFYRSFQLLEVLVRHGAGYHRSYALVARRGTVLQMESLNGKAQVIHQVNAQPGELVIDRQTADSYLRFFCWAVHGSGGPFYVPLSLREAPLNRMPADAQAAAILYQLQFGISEVGDEEAARLGYGTTDTQYRRKATIAYDSAIFEASFAVQLTGMIEMINDEPRAADLELRKEQYGQGPMFVLRDFVKPRGPRPTLRHYAREASRELVTTAAAPRRSLSSVQDLVDAIGADGELTGGDVNAPLVLESRDLLRRTSM